MHLRLKTVFVLLALPLASAVLTFTVNPNRISTWVHHWEESIGSGHAALTTRADWRDHLSRCRKELGVKRTRFHGLLDDDFSISMREGSPDYVNLDSLVDFHLSIGMEPLFEVSFMPSWLANDTSQTVCHYKGISSPPTNYTKWGVVVHDMAAHLYARYPDRRFMFEVWNEPNIGFWSGVPKQSTYLQLYKETADNLKAASNGHYRVGGPATAGCDSNWISALVNTTSAVDFISCHAYGGGADKNKSGQLSGLKGLPHSSSYGGRPIAITEWSSSWSYNNGYHDDVASAPFIIAAVQEMDVAVSSYWTFSDVFEEGTLIPTPFHGGFGLLTINGTPKPSYRAFQLLHGTGAKKYFTELTQASRDDSATASQCKTDAGVLVTDLDRSVTGGTGMRIFMFNHPQNFETVGSSCNITVEGLSISSPSLVNVTRIDQSNSNPMQAWIDMRSPTYPTTAELAKLEAASELAWGMPGDNSHSPLHKDGTGLTFEVPPNGLVVVDVLSA